MQVEPCGAQRDDLNRHGLEGNRSGQREAMSQLLGFSDNENELSRGLEDALNSSEAIFLVQIFHSNGIKCSTFNKHRIQNRHTFSTA